MGRRGCQTTRQQALLATCTDNGSFVGELLFQWGAWRVPSSTSARRTEPERLIERLHRTHSEDVRDNYLFAWLETCASAAVTRTSAAEVYAWRGRLRGLLARV